VVATAPVRNDVFRELGRFIVFFSDIDTTDGIRPRQGGVLSDISLLRTLITLLR
jgi:hypothetical protein